MFGELGDNERKPIRLYIPALCVGTFEVTAAWKRRTIIETGIETG